MSKRETLPIRERKPENEIPVRPGFILFYKLPSGTFVQAVIVKYLIVKEEDRGSQYDRLGVLLRYREADQMQEAAISLNVAKWVCRMEEGEPWKRPLFMLSVPRSDGTIDRDSWAHILSYHSSLTEREVVKLIKYDPEGKSLEKIDIPLSELVGIL